MICAFVGKEERKTSGRECFVRYEFFCECSQHIDGYPNECINSEDVNESKFLQYIVDG